MVTKKRAKKPSKELDVCVNCGTTTCKKFILYKKKLFCCDMCKKSYSKKTKQKVCEFC